MIAWRSRSSEDDWRGAESDIGREDDGDDMAGDRGRSGDHRSTSRVTLAGDNDAMKRSGGRFGARTCEQ